MEEKHFKNTVRNYILLTVLVVPIILLTVLIFVPLVLERFGLLENYETYLSIASPAITFISILFTGGIAIYVMYKNHKHNLELEKTKIKEQHELSERKTIRYLIKIQMIADGYVYYFNKNRDYSSTIVDEVFEDLKYIITLTDKCLELPFKTDTKFENVMTKTLNNIYMETRNIEKVLMNEDNDAGIRVSVKQCIKGKFRTISEEVTKRTRELGYELGHD